MRSAPVLLLALVFYTNAQTAAPKTPAGAVFRLWLDAFNSGDSSKELAFWKKYGSDAPERHVQGDLGLRNRIGALNMLKVIESTDTHLVALMKDASGGYSESTIELASSSPPVIAHLSGHPVPPPTNERPALNDKELAARVRSHVAAMAAQDRFSGSVLIGHNGKVVVEDAWGLADREKQIENKADTQFCIGSLNKMFTATAILQLVQQGKLSLDGTVSDYWPSYPNHDLASKVKIRHLLSHTGGTGDIFTPEYEAQRLETHTLADYVKLFGSRGLEFEPGSRMEYSNYGFILLGRIIEIVSGRSYEEYVREHMYALAGMTHTNSRPETELVVNRATGYTRGPAGLQANTAMLPWGGTSAGGGYSTAGDLFRFATALHGGKLLDRGLLQQATTDQSHAGYGYGFYVLRDGMYGHGGGFPGVNAELRVIPVKGYVIAVLANRDPPTASEVESYSEAILPAREAGDQ